MVILLFNDEIDYVCSMVAPKEQTRNPLRFLKQTDDSANRRWAYTFLAMAVK
jgi:hypothetical protein